MQTVAWMANEMSNLDEQANEKEENQDQLILVNNRRKWNCEENRARTNLIAGQSAQ